MDGHAGRYQIAFGCLPPTAVSGEVVACEVKVLPPQPDADVTIALLVAGRPVPLQVHREDEAGVYGAEYRFPAPGTYEASVRVGQDPLMPFSVTVSAGLVEWLRGLTSVVLLLLGCAWGFRRIRRRAGVTSWSDRRLMTRAAAYPAATLLLVAAADRFVVPRVATALLPTRSNASVDWSSLGVRIEPREYVDSEQVDNLSAPRASGQRSNTGNPDATTESIELTGRIVARPGAVADVIVPMTGRVVFAHEFAPRLGMHVGAGQTLVQLEHHYVMDDALHLVNERWPILTEMLAAKRHKLEASAALAKSQYLYKQGNISRKALQDAEAAAAITTIEYDRWRENLTKHDIQINASELITRPIPAPITGTIVAANFTQGQLVYEGHKLFTLADVSTVWVRLDVPEQLAERAAANLRRVQYSTVSLPGETFSGVFVKAAQVVDATTRTVPFFFEVANRDKRLKIGMGVSARIDQAVQSGIGTTEGIDSRRAPVSNEVVRATGVIEADPQLQAQVVAPLWGRIEFAKRPLSVGDRVGKGEELARLVLELSIAERYPMDTRRAEIAKALEGAKKRTEQADIDFRRAIALFKSKPTDEFFKLQVESTEEIYRAAVEDQRLLTRQADTFETVVKRRDPKVTVVTAPIAGTITEIAFTPGQLGETQQFPRLFTITNLSRVWIVADVFAKDIETVRNCRSASFTPAGGAARPLGRPIVIADSLDETTGTLRVIFQVANPAGDLRLGSFATLTFDVD